MNHLQNIGVQTTSTEAPDREAIKDIASMLQSYSHSDHPDNTIPMYKVGDMTSQVYPVEGGLEDWAYAAGWENSLLSIAKPVKDCKTSFNNNFQWSSSNSNNVKCVMYLVESNYNKQPAESTYGNSEHILDDTAVFK